MDINKKSSNQMIKKNAVLSALLSVAFLGVTACGGGGSDNSTPTTPGTGGTTNPGAGGTTNPGAGDGTTSPVVKPEFAAGTYFRVSGGTSSEILVLDNSLLLLHSDKNEQLLGKFDITNVVADLKVSDAPGIIKFPSKIVSDNGKFSINLSVNNSNIIDKMTSISVTDGSTLNSFSGTFSLVSNVTDLSSFNSKWMEYKFPSFSIDNNSTLTAKDIDGCDITGTLTKQVNDTFSVELSYIGCDKAGSYSGSMWAYTYDSVTYLSWLAFDSNNNPVAGKVDTYSSDWERLKGTNANLLEPALYVGSTGYLINNTDTIRFSGTTIGVFTFKTPLISDDTPVISATGSGLEWPLYTEISAGLELYLPARKYERFSGNIAKGSFSNSFKDFQKMTPLLSSLEGTWNKLVIASDGTLSGEIAECVISTGTISNYTNGVADIDLTCTDKDSNVRHHQGLAAGYSAGSAETLAIIINDAKGYISGIIPKS